MNDHPPNGEGRAFEAVLRRSSPEGPVDWVLAPDPWAPLGLAEAVSDAGVRQGVEDLRLALERLLDRLTPTEPPVPVQLDEDTIAALKPKPLPSSIAVSNDGRALTVDGAVRVMGAVAVATAAGSPLGVADDYTATELLEDQSGADGVLTFTFSSAVNLVVVVSKGTDLTSRADPSGGTPTATKGFVCDDAAPVYLPVITSEVKVFAPAGTRVSVSGFRR